MKSRFAGLGLLFFSSVPAFAGHLLCTRAPCPIEIKMVSVAEDKSYGLLLEAPETGCRRVRYRIETLGHDLLGKTPVLHSGEVAVVRMGLGFAEGTHTLLVRAEGCAKPPILARRVALRKLSPDHGWRASLVNAKLARTP